MMQAFTRHNGLAAPFERDDIDTDLIIPKQFLKSIKRSGYGDFLFDSLRYADSGGTLGMDCSSRLLNADFELNQSRYHGASILIAGANFGCGSSREHAVWALMDAGYRCVIAPSFADIFYSNAGNNGLLAIILPSAQIKALFVRLRAQEGFALNVDLDAQCISLPDGEKIAFEIEPALKQRLLEGLDDISYCLSRESESIRAYEARAGAREPWRFFRPRV